METTVLFTSAFVVGVFHAVEPGHGKTAMVGTLIASKRPWRDPIYLGLGTATGHALGVFIFAHLSFYFAHSMLDGFIRTSVELTVASLLLASGAFWIWRIRLTSQHSHNLATPCSCHHHFKVNDKKNLFLPGLGFLIGLIPCPSAIALAVSAVSFSEPSQVFFLSLVFGLGVAITLSSIGIAITHGSGAFSKLAWFDKMSPYAVYIGPLVFCLMGLLLLAHAVTGHS
jgi:nickel/cobalt exporter